MDIRPLIVEIAFNKLEGTWLEFSNEKYNEIKKEFEFKEMSINPKNAKFSNGKKISTCEISEKTIKISIILIKDTNECEIMEKFLKNINMSDEKLISIKEVSVINLANIKKENLIANSCFFGKIYTDVECINDFNINYEITTKDDIMELKILYSNSDDFIYYINTSKKEAICKNSDEMIEKYKLKREKLLKKNYDIIKSQYKGIKYNKGIYAYE